MSDFTGYLIDEEQRDLLRAESIDFDFGDFVCSGDIPDTRGVEDLMRRDDQNQMSSCTGFGLTNACEVGFWLQTGKWKQFNPHWSYIHGQKVNNIRGDRGAVVHGVVSAAKEVGLLPEDGDGLASFPYPDRYEFRYPGSANEIAEKRKIGYSVELRSFDAILKFLQANQGGVICGGPFGNWTPAGNGICDRFSGGGGGHSMAYVDWKKINGQFHIVCANSHYKRFGLNGFCYMTERFMEAQFRDSSFCAFGVSDLTLGPGDKPKQRIPRFVKLF